MRANRESSDRADKCPKTECLGAAGCGPPPPPGAARAGEPPRARARLSRFRELFRTHGVNAAGVCAAAGVCGLAGALLAAGCAGALDRPGPLSVRTGAPPSETERYCAWYGDRRDDVLYFGQAAFWSAYRAADGDPKADLAKPGPVPIGRFDLAGERHLPPLEVGTSGARSGVWDVLAHPNGRVYFTTYFEGSGWVEPDTGRVRHLPDLGTGLNEIAPGPDGSILISRYGAAEGGRAGSVLVVSPDGDLLAEHPVEPPAGYIAAPKTVAFDPGRREIWVTTDLLPTEGTDASVRHDAYVLAEDGRELRRIEHPEVQFVAFAPDGGGYAAEAERGALWLRRIPPPGEPEPDRMLLEADFPAGWDFAQDIHFAEGGRAVVARWSGAIHVADFDAGTIRRGRLPALDPEGLYYSAVLAGDRVCATYCADVSVVCQDAP